MPTPTCSFCARPESAFRRFVAGPGVFICSDCVRTAAQSLAEGTDAATTVVCALCQRADAPEHYILVEGGGYVCNLCARAVHQAVQNMQSH
jgi:ATP-dependent protease Clp ATPase subunit